MSFMGNAAMVAWHDLVPGCETQHDDWHSHEHMFERVGIPGFRRGRRCRAVEASEEYFLLYEVDDLSVLTSDGYLTRLNDPTEWSQRVIPNIRNMTRTLCCVRASFGGGVGSALLTIRLSTSEEGRAKLVTRLAEEVLPRFETMNGIVGAHFLEGYRRASGVTTDEMRLRGGGDKAADLVLIVEGYDLDAVSSIRDGPLSSSNLSEMGSESGIKKGVYRLAHVLTEADFPAD